jgi:hypothetical protein
MLPGATPQVPASLARLLAVFPPLFTVPSFRTFCGLACGFLAQPGRRTVRHADRGGLVAGVAA